MKEPTADADITLKIYEPTAPTRKNCAPYVKVINWFISLITTINLKMSLATGGHKRELEVPRGPLTKMETTSRNRSLAVR